MNSNNFNSSSINLRFGESAAVAAAKPYLDKHIDLVSSPAYVATLPKSSYKQHNHKSAVNDDFLDELLKDSKFTCKGKYEACKARDVTDEDVRKLMKNRPKAEVRVSFNEAELDKELQAIMSNEEKLKNTKEVAAKDPKNSLKPIPQPATGSRIQIDKSPPRKIVAQTPPATKQNDLDLLQNIAKSFNKKPQPVKQNPPYKTPTVPVSKPIESPPQDDLPVTTSMYKDFRSAKLELRLQNTNYRKSDPIQPNKVTLEEKYPTNKQYKNPASKPKPQPEAMQVDSDEDDPLLKGIDPEILDAIKSEVIVNTQGTSWDDIAGKYNFMEKFLNLCK